MSCVLLQSSSKPQRIVPCGRLLRGGTTEGVAGLWECLEEPFEV